jgi:hypothetical protein
VLRVCSCWQDENLRLKPWQPLPCDADLDWLAHGDDGTMGRYAAAKLLERLLAFGLSRWEPDPKRAIAAAEAARRGGRSRRLRLDGESSPCRSR